MLLRAAGAVISRSVFQSVATAAIFQTKYVVLNAVKNPTEELTSIYFITLVVGYFANAQYDVLFKIYLTKASATFNPVALSKPLKNALEFTSQTVKPFSVNKKSIPQ